MAIIGRLSAFWLNEIIRTAVLFVSAYFLGLWVLRRGIRVNYTRKIQHFTLFFVPMVLAAYIPFTPSLYTVFGSGLVFLASLALFTQPIRSRSTLIATAFASLDRPEDRPYTLLWLSTQILATYVVLVLMLVWLERYEKSILIYVTVLVAGIGDGLAEPVGVRFGRHTYTTRRSLPSAGTRAASRGAPACSRAAFWRCTCCAGSSTQPSSASRWRSFHWP